MVKPWQAGAGSAPRAEGAISGHSSSKKSSGRGWAVMKVSARALRCAGLPLLVLGLMAATAVDADGDVATTNLPSVVLVTTRNLQPVDDAKVDTSDSDLLTYEKKSAALIRRLRRLVASPGITSGLHHAVRSIRGP